MNESFSEYVGTRLKVWRGCLISFSLSLLSLTANTAVFYGNVRSSLYLVDVLEK